MDWKQKIDENNEQKRLAAEQFRKEREAREKTEHDVEVGVIDKQRMEHLFSFKCHICMTASKIPGTKVEQRSHGEWADTFETVTDWSEPGDLFKCKSCGEWTCINHIYKEVCQTCGERLSNIN